MPRLVIWNGHLTTRTRLMLRGWSMIGWGVAWLVGLLVLPGMALVAVSFARPGVGGEIVWEFSADNFRRLMSVETVKTWSGVGADEAPVLRTVMPYVRILARSAWVGLVTTVLSVLLAYPLAFFIAARPPRTRYLWLSLVIIPFCTNLVIRTYAWMPILSSQSWPSRWLRGLGILAEEQGLYPGALAVFIGMLTSSLPFAVLPLYASIERLDWSLVDAARDLYATRRGVFRHAVLPQTLPGLSVAVVLTFIPAMGMFVVPDLLGGAKVMLVGNLINQQFGDSQNLPFGSAVSIALMVLTLTGLLIVRRTGRGVEPS